MSFIIGGISFLAVPLYMSIISIITVLLPQYSRFLESTKYTSDTELSIETILFFIVIFALLVCCFKSICFDGFLMRKCKNKYFIENERGNLSNNDVIFLFFVLKKPSTKRKAKIGNAILPSTSKRLLLQNKKIVITRLNLQY